MLYDQLLVLAGQLQVRVNVKGILQTLGTVFTLEVKLEGARLALPLPVL
jgi:hypothetical protein